MGNILCHTILTAHSTDWSTIIDTLESNRKPLISGVYAAMTLPRTDAGLVDLPQLAHHITSLLRCGLKGFVLNGATGEYCLTSVEELGAMLRHTRALVGKDANVMAAIGGADMRHTLQRLAAVHDAGADGVLLPMPYFFPYEQQDLVAYASAVAEESSLPILLYNLPSFTTPLQAETSLQIIQRSSPICGIKDSSGHLDTMRLLKEYAPDANRIIGNDAALYDALRENVCDGVVSGVSCVLPELMLALYSATRENALGARALQLRAALDGFIDWLTLFPVPWGLKAIAQERGFARAEYALPRSTRRNEQLEQFIAWFHQNRASLLA